MGGKRLGAVELRFAELIWEHAPLSSTELVRLCAAELDWKKSTTYTVLKKLCDRGLFENDGGTVRAKMTREAFNAAKSEEIVNERFHGSLPAFVAAFMSANRLSAQEAAQIEAMIEAYKKETEQ